VPAGVDQTVRLWDLATAGEAGVFDHQCVGPVAFDPAGELVTLVGIADIGATRCTWRENQELGSE
jgi:hypothetical protein